MNATSWGALAAWASVLVYIALLVFAVRQVGEAKKLRRAQIRPFVVVDIAPGWILYITVENIGTTLARNVTFEFPEPLESSLDSPVEFEEAPFLKNGLKVLPPRKRYRVLFDAINNRAAREDLPMSYEVIVRYEDDDGNEFTDPYPLDMTSMLHTSPEEKGLPDLVAELEKINAELDKWTDGVRGLLVHTRDRDEMVRQQKEDWEKRSAVLEAARAAAQPTDPGVDG